MSGSPERLPLFFKSTPKISHSIEKMETRKGISENKFYNAANVLRYRRQ